MMNPALLGIVSAVAWGGADFTARFTSRAIGHASSLLGMLAAGFVILSVWFWATSQPLVWDAGQAWLMAAAGVAVMVQTLFLYQALARGPVSVVAPIVGCYPALVLLFAVAMGTRPGFMQWAAMAAVMTGVVVVGRTAKPDPNEAPPPGGLRRTFVISAAAAFFYALGVIAGQASASVFGELQTLWASRWIGLVALIPLFLLPPFRFQMPIRWVPLIALQGVLDATGYLAVLAPGRGEGAEITAVIGSAFGAVAALLARVFLKERITFGQWGGIALIMGGVAILSGAK
jgi:drug/metabolite transporter (DMT)-like permease